MQSIIKLDPQSLPCGNCPYGGACCRYGVTLSRNEVQAITAKFGAEYVYRDENGDWRTEVRDGRCVFQDPQNGACGIHGEDFYPAQCWAYPWYTVEESESEPGAFVDVGVAYPHPYDCPAMVLVALDVYFQELATNPAGLHRKIALDELTSKILPPGHEF